MLKSTPPPRQSRTCQGTASSHSCSTCPRGFFFPLVPALVPVPLLDFLLPSKVSKGESYSILSPGFGIAPTLGQKLRRDQSTSDSTLPSQREKNMPQLHLWISPLYLEASANEECILMAISRKACYGTHFSVSILSATREDVSYGGRVELEERALKTESL